MTGTSGGNNTIVVASRGANSTNAAAFASRTDGVGIVGDGGIVCGVGMIDWTAGVEGDVSVTGTSAVGNTVFISSGDADGADDAAFDSHVTVVETDFCNATRNNKHLLFCPIPWVGGLFEWSMAIVNGGLPTTF